MNLPLPSQPLNAGMIICATFCCVVIESTRSLITQLIAREKKITNYPNGEYKEELLNILYCDMVDILSTARGLNLSHERVGNYNKKVDSYMKLLSMKEKDMDLSNVKEILNDIEDNINEAYKLTNAVDPRTWFLIETFTNGLTNVLLIEDPNLFRRQISLYNKDNLLYNQIIFQLTNYIEGKTNTK